MHQFFVDREQIGTEYITITGEDVKHIKNVHFVEETKRKSTFEIYGISTFVCI